MYCYRITIFLYVTLSIAFVKIAKGDSHLTIAEQDVNLAVGKRGQLKIYYKSVSAAVLKLSVNIEDLVSIPDEVTIEPGVSDYMVNYTCVNAGRVILNVSLRTSNDTVSDEKYVRITVHNSEIVYGASKVLGWLYFACWFSAVYPQIYTNYRRKSVGLNFDFVTLSFVGSILQFFFYCGLKWIPVVEEEYRIQFPGSPNPVQAQDLILTGQVSLTYLIVVIQCIIYEEDNQKVSWPLWVIHGAFALTLIISGILSIVKVTTWLQFLYYFSYIKLVTTLIKYCPQGYMNHKRQSTEGCSMWNIFLDMIGGILIIIQMILCAYNCSDWEPIFGDPAKFGLGVFSTMFDAFFFVQHFIMFKESASIDLNTLELSPKEEESYSSVTVSEGISDK